MNKTNTSESSNGYEMTMYLMVGMFLLSELLPFVKRTKASGLIHSVVCLLKGSECVAKKARTKIEKIEQEMDKI